MNIGEKIKTLREENNMTVEALAERISDSIENINKYEKNELEPTLDKKLAISIALGVTLSDLSFSIEQKVLDSNKNLINDDDNKPLEENKIEEIPFANSTITYSENIFNKIFKKDYNRYFIQFIISFFGYVLVGLYTILYRLNIIAYLCFGFAAYSIIKLVFTLIRFKNGKKVWLEQYNGVRKDYKYYNDYIVITSEDERYPEMRFNYNHIVRALEKEGLIICMVDGEQRSIVTIDKSTLDDESLIKVRTAIENHCPNYINIEQIDRQKKELGKKTKNLNIILWLLTIFSVLSLFLVKLIFGLTGLDNTLMNNILIYIIALIIPLISIIMGIVAKKKFSFSSKKNIIVGIIVGVFCIFSIGMVLVNHKILTNNNNDKLVEVIKNNTQTIMPNDYYTIYYENEMDNITKDKINYNIETYQIMTFNKKSEIKELESSIKNNFNWKNKNDDITYKDIFTIHEDAKKMIVNLGYEFSEEADYFLIFNLNKNKVGELNYDDGDKYLFLSYYDSGNYLLAIEFTCLLISN